MLKDSLTKAPTWALLLVLAVAMPVAGWTVRDHLDADRTQTEEIKQLVSTVQQLAVVVEYNYKETEKNSEAVADMQEVQQRLEVLMARIEERLDRDASS